jgi:hypothetical protein
MIFDLSQKHEKANKDTFFGYFKDDKSVKDFIPKVLIDSIKENERKEIKNETINK